MRQLPITLIRRRPAIPTQLTRPRRSITGQTSLCSFIFRFLWDRGVQVVVWNNVLVLALVGRRGHGIFHYHWWTALIWLRLLLSPCKLCFLMTSVFLTLIILNWFSIIYKVLPCLETREAKSVLLTTVWIKNMRKLTRVCCFFSVLLCFCGHYSKYNHDKQP